MLHEFRSLLYDCIRNNRCARNTVLLNLSKIIFAPRGRKSAARAKLGESSNLNDEHLRRTGQLLIAYQLKCADQTIVAAAKASADAADVAIREATKAAVG